MPRATAINRLTEPLPWEERLAIQNEYANKLPGLHYLLEKYPYLIDEVGSAESIEVLLAIALFYMRVIKPLEGGVQFADVVFSDPEISDIRIGNYSINRAERDQIEAIVNWFGRFMHRNKLTTAVFDFVEVNEFLFKLRDHVRTVRRMESNAQQ